MRRILAGIETEYGLLVEGRGAAEQIEDAKALVRSYPGECLPIWDYRHESPRADLRGFQLERLAVDPVDLQFDVGKDHGDVTDVRSDCILPNGARFYNDHGHPEYATPECYSLRELALHDRYGERVVHSAAKEFERETGFGARLFKNNTDFHGASYGTHESYLVPRSLGFEALYRAVLPMLVCRQVLTGAGKVGSESGAWCDFQISQRADFFVEPVNAETLYRRPIFNTRDEAHADPSQWIRLHVISGDANMNGHSTMRKVGLVKLAIFLAEAGTAPMWDIQDPVKAFMLLSRDADHCFRVELSGKNWTTAYEILESCFAAAEATLEVDEEIATVITECRELLKLLRANQWEATRGRIDWAAKRHLLSQFLESEGSSWKDAVARSLDLEYHNVDRDEGLFYALEEMADVTSIALETEVEMRSRGQLEGTRAHARAIAVSRFGDHVYRACWRSITFRIAGRLEEVELDPEMVAHPHLSEAMDVESFIKMLRGAR